MKIPVITVGSFDDYRILVAVDGTLEDARLLASRLRGSGRYSDANEEELLVVKADIPQVEVLKVSTTIWDDGQVDEAQPRVSVQWPWERYNSDDELIAAAEWRWVRAPMHMGKGGRLDVEGTDHALVRQVLAEEAERILANRALSERTSAKGEYP